MPQVCILNSITKKKGICVHNLLLEACQLLQDEALLVSWKHQLDRDAETLKMKGNLNHLRTVRTTTVALHNNSKSIIFGGGCSKATLFS